MANEYDVNYRGVETDVEKCPSCAGKMFFDPNTQMLKCEYCGFLKRVEKNKNVVENDIEKGFEEAEKWNKNEQVTYTCENCGAMVIVRADEQAVVCPYCGTSHVVKSGSFEGIKPHAVIPFMSPPRRLPNRRKNGRKNAFLLRGRSKKVLLSRTPTAFTSRASRLTATPILLIREGSATGIRG